MVVVACEHDSAALEAPTGAACGTASVAPPADRQRLVNRAHRKATTTPGGPPLRPQILALRWGSERNERSGMDTEDVGSRDFMFGATGVLMMVVVAIAFALFS